jgi:uncharacterized protein (DUF3820 family)
MSNHYKPLEKKRVMWGKHAGKLFSEVPTDYLKWFVSSAYPQMKNRRTWALEELARREDTSKSKDLSFVEDMRGRFREKFPHKIAAVIDDFGDTTKSDFLEFHLAELRAFAERIVPPEKNPEKNTYAHIAKLIDGGVSMRVYSEGYNAAIAAMRENITRELNDA